MICDSDIRAGTKPEIKPRLESWVDTGAETEPEMERRLETGEETES